MSPLTTVPGIRVLDRGNQLAAIVTIEVAGWDATDLSKLLRKRGINTSASLCDQPQIHRGACESQRHSTQCTLPRTASARLSWNLRMGTWSLASYRWVALPPLRPPWLFAGLRHARPAGVLECLWRSGPFLAHGQICLRESTHLPALEVKN